MTNPIRQALTQKAKDFLDPDLEGNAAEAIAFFLADSDPIGTLETKNKLLLLKAIYDSLGPVDRNILGCRKFNLTSTLDSGDYGIDIEDSLPLDNNWNLIIRADGGSGSICPGEDTRAIEFDLQSLLDRLYLIDYHLDSLYWDDLGANGSTDDDDISVTPGEGTEGQGEPSFSVVSARNDSIEAAEVSIRATADENSSPHRVEISFVHQGEQLNFTTSFDLLECESRCLGYNLYWKADEPQKSGEFASQVHSLLREGLSMLQQAIKKVN